MWIVLLRHFFFNQGMSGKRILAQVRFVFYAAEELRSLNGYDKTFFALPHCTRSTL